MKKIILLQGMGNNERGWAKQLSAYAHTTLIQQGVVQHVEVWHNGHCTFDGPQQSVTATRKFDEWTLNSLTIWRSFWRCAEAAGDGKVDLIISANYSMTLAALLLRFFGRTRRVVMLVSDFLPVRGKFIVRVSRRMTAWLGRFAARRADEVWSVSPRIPTAAVNPRNFVVPFRLENNPQPAGARAEIGYVGFPSDDHALEILFEICKKNSLRLNIIGQSGYLESIKRLAPADAVFHGTLNDPAKINAILSRCFCGYAVYRETGPQSYSYFGIPSKTFFYFASNIPIVTTNTAHFTQNIERAGLGHVVAPVPAEIEKAILDLRANYPRYAAAIEKFRTGWNAGSENFHRERLKFLLDEPILE